MKLRILLALVVTAATLGTTVAAPSFKAMSAEDFFLDRKILLGESVEVQAQFQAVGDTVFILLRSSTRFGVANATFVNVDELSRDERKLLYARCQEICEATVRGNVKIVPGPLGSDVGIVAQYFALKP